MKNTTQNRSEKILIGGTFVTPRAEIAHRYLLDDPSSDFTNRARFFPLADAGLGHMDDTYADMRERVLRFRDRTDKPVVAAGHSQGALYALDLYLDGVVDGAVMFAGPHAGIDHTKSSNAQRLGKLVTSLGKYMDIDPKYMAQMTNAPIVSELMPDSDYMVRHLQSLRDGVTDDSHVRFVAATRDGLVPSESVVGAGPDHLKRVIIPYVGRYAVWSRSDVRRDIKPLPNPAPANHLTMLWAPAARRVFNRMQTEVA